MKDLNRSNVRLCLTLYASFSGRTATQVRPAIQQLLVNHGCFLDYVRSVSKADAGPATVAVVYSHSAPFLKMLEVIISFLEADTSRHEHFVWIDIFAKNPSSPVREAYLSRNFIRCSIF